jgi:hypothetical protein
MVVQSRVLGENIMVEGAHGRGGRQEAERGNTGRGQGKI